MENKSAIIAVAVIIIIVILALMIGYSYYPSSYGDSSNAAIPDIKEAQRSAAKKQLQRGRLSGSPSKGGSSSSEKELIWKKWTMSNNEEK